MCGIKDLNSMIKTNLEIITPYFIIFVLILHAFMFLFLLPRSLFLFNLVNLIVSLLHSLVHQDSYSSSSSSLIEFWEDVSFSWLGGGPCVCM